MTTWVFPSNSFPALTGASLSVPPGWVPVRLPATSLAVMEPARSGGGFRSNVTLGVERAATNATLESLGAAADVDLSRLDGVQVITSGFLDVAPGTAVVREVAFRHAEAGTLVLSNLLLLVEHDGAVDLVRLTATSAGDRSPEHIDELRESLASVTTDVGVATARS